MAFQSLKAQEIVHGQTLYWIRYQNQLIFSPKVFWNNEADNRRFVGHDVQNQLIFHSRVHYKTGRWDLATGVTYSFAYAAIPESGYNTAVDEFRPVVEASYEWPVKRSGIQMRLRADNRFFQASPERSVFTESDYVFRFRYRIQTRIPLKFNEDGIPKITLRLADEIMFNTEENFFDQNRIYATFDFMLSPSWSLECGYIYIYQQKFARDEEFFSRNVLRFSVLHKIHLR